MKQLRSLMILCFFFIAGSLIAQNQVSGIVTSEMGTLPGVTILEKGTVNGTITDMEGNFDLFLESGDPVLVFSMVGFATKEVPVDGKSQLTITMEEDITGLQEVVVIGYGTAKKNELTSSISIVEGKDLNKMTVGNVAESMQGLASGVQVLYNGGGPGSSPKLLIRGIVTNQGSDPLIVVDGVALPQGSNLNFLNPSDIKSIQVLKDGSASSIYGTRASNGVVLVTTERGNLGKSSISASLSFGLKALQQPDMANASEYAQVMNARQENDGQTAVYDLTSLENDTDWWGEVYKDFANVQNYSIRLNGGTEKINYLNSLAYFREDSHLEKGYWERLSNRSNVDFYATDKLFIQQDVNIRYEHWENTPNMFFDVMRIDPLTSVYLPFDQRENRNEYSIYGRSQNYVWNPVANVNRSFNESFYFGLFSNTKVNYDITDNLSISSRLGLNIDQLRNDWFEPKFVIEPNLEENQRSKISSRYTNTFNYVWNNLVNYNRRFGTHNIDLTAGLVFERNQSNYLDGRRTDVILSDPNFRYLDAATGDGIEAYGNETANSLQSYLARAMYNYDDRYFAFASFRRDGSSRFPVSNQWANFYSFSGGWKISNESFFNVSWISNLKVKAGYGQVGNQNIPASAFSYLVDSESFVFGEDKDRVVTNYISQFGNPSLKWETVQDQNYGVDVGLFDNKLTLTLDRYIKESKDLLFATTLPLFTGSPSTIMQNVGSFKSTGWDVSLAYQQSVGDWTFGINSTFNTNESIVQSLATGNDQLLAQKREELGNNFLKITQVGEVVGLFYGYETDGIFKSQTEINSHSDNSGQLIQPSAQPGDLKFIDQNDDGILDEKDLTIIGNPFPKFYSGLTFNMQYKNWDMNMQWYGSFGNDVYNYMKYYQTSGVGGSNVQAGLLNDSWSEQNSDATIPRLTALDPNRNFKVSSDYFIEDGSYVRLKNLQIGYNFQFSKLTQCRVYVSGQNLFTFTQYTGMDPEVSDANTSVIDGLGVDYSPYPLTRTYLLGLNISF